MTGRVKTSARGSWDEAVELSERDELGRYIEARLLWRRHPSLHVRPAREGHQASKHQSCSHASHVPHPTASGHWRVEALTQLPLR